MDITIREIREMLVKKGFKNRGGGNHNLFVFHPDLGDFYIIEGGGEWTRYKNSIDIYREIKNNKDQEDIKLVASYVNPSLETIERCFDGLLEKEKMNKISKDIENSIRRGRL